MPSPSRKVSKKAPAAKPDGRPVKHPEVVTENMFGDAPLTVERAKELLGWEEVPDDERKAQAAFVDLTGKPVRLRNNTRNRPFYMSLALTWAQEVLRKRWSGPNGNGKTVNGETIIFGRTGEVISFQHRGVGLVFAEQMRTGPDAARWAEFWDGPVVMDTIAVFGVDESDDVVNTVDTGKSRSESDVIYRMPYFLDRGTTERRVLSATLAGAAKFLWDRTGAKFEGTVRTHAELQDFIERHKRLLKAVVHVVDENDKNAIGQWVNPGTAAGLLYLMGCSDTVEDKVRLYREGPHEKALDWSAWEKACEFWVLLGANAKEFHEVRQALNGLGDPDDTSIRGSLKEVITVVTKAWGEFHSDGRLTPATLKLEYQQDANGVNRLVNVPTVGGIDVGYARKKVETEEEPTEEEVEAAKAEIRAEVAKAKADPDAAATEAALKRLWEAHPGKVLVFRNAQGNQYYGLGKDATALASTMQGKVSKHSTGLNVFLLNQTEFNTCVKALHEQKRKVAVVTGTNEAQTVTDVTPPPVPTPKATPKPQPRPGGPKASALKAEQLKNLEN